MHFDCPSHAIIFHHCLRIKSVLLESSPDLPATLPAVHRRWRHLLDHRRPDTRHQRRISRCQTLHATAFHQAFSVVGLGLSKGACRYAIACLFFRPTLAAVWGLCGAGFGCSPHWQLHGCPLMYASPATQGACSSLGRLQTVRSAVSTSRKMTNERSGARQCP